MYIAPANGKGHSYITIKNNINWDALQFPVQPIIRLDKKLAVSKCYKCLN